jgi:hypothetical protein
MWNRRHRWTRRLATGFAFAGLVVPAAAQAEPIQVSGDRPGGEPIAEYNGYGYRQSPGVPLADQKSGIEWVVDNGHVLKDGMWVKQPQVANAGIRFFGDYVSQPSGATVAVRPDDRAVRISPQPVDSTNVVRPDDRSVRFTPSGGELPQVVAAPSTGFDWGDAGIGAATVFGLMLLALGAALATRHANRKALAGA